MINFSDCTIIIPHLGATEKEEYAIEHCMASLDESVHEMPKVIAKNTTHCTGQHVIPNCSVLRISDQGQCKAVNAAVATTNTEWIIVANDDQIFPPGWWERLNRWDIHPACISPQLVEPRPGAPTFIVQDFGGAGGDFKKDDFVLWSRSHPKTMQNFRKGFNLPFMMKRDLWDMVGGYDINYDPWGSNGDSDLEYKIKLAGVQPYQNTDSIVYHFSQTSGTFEPRNDEFRNRNYAYFKEKWGFDRTDEGIWEATFEIPKPPTRKFMPKWEGKYESST
jgi:hypothetical protein